MGEILEIAKADPKEKPLVERMTDKASASKDGSYTGTVSLADFNKLKSVTSGYAVVKLKENEDGTVKFVIYNLEKHVSYLLSEARKKGKGAQTFEQVAYDGSFLYDKKALQAVLDQLRHEDESVVNAQIVDLDDGEFRKLTLFNISAIKRVAKSTGNEGTLEIESGKVDLGPVFEFLKKEGFAVVNLGSKYVLYDLDKHVTYLKSEAKKTDKVQFTFLYDKATAESISKLLSGEGRFIVSAENTEQSGFELRKLTVYNTDSFKTAADASSTGIASIDLSNVDSAAAIKAFNSDSSNYRAYYSRGRVIVYSIEKAALGYKQKFEKSSSVDLLKISYIQGVETDPIQVETVGMQIASLISDRLNSLLPGNSFVVRKESVGTDLIIRILKIKEEKKK